MSAKSKALMKALRNVLHSVKEMLARTLGRRPPTEKPAELTRKYSSHLPVLVGLARLLKVRRVLELGPGYYSTSTFLDRSAFKDLEVLHSLEDDPVWIEKLTGMVRKDSRANMLSVPRPVSEAVEWVRLPYYDLVLVDDSTSLEERSVTIRRVAEYCSKSAVVVIHDYEHKAYQEAAKGFRNRFAFTALTPNTGIAWNDAPIEPSHLEELNALIEKHKGRAKPQILTEWVYTMDVCFAESRGYPVSFPPRG